MAYPHRQIEAKWQAYWDLHKTFKTPDRSEKPKYYILDMFPYPSGAGLHVGHPEGYTATDIIARYKRMRGFNVLHPMGWDAFGLPAENYAIKTGTHPNTETQKNIRTFKRQIKALGFSYDWDREIDTTDPKYYRWTQWIFLQLFKKGLAYEADVSVNWCPALKTVLANEEVVDGKSEIGGHPVVRRPMRQWMLRITAYADRLIDDLDSVEWPESVKEMQRQWIGRSEGARIRFDIAGGGGTIDVFTTRPDTLFGATYMVLAPEHPLVTALTTPEQRPAVAAYCEAAARKSDLDRTDLAKEKTGVFTGGYALHPVTGAKIPVWIADYVLASYGTGAIMAVPGHDERDWEFARQFALPVVEVVAGGNAAEAAFTGAGRAVNSGFLEGLETAAAKKRMIEWLVANGRGDSAVSYKLRDWLFSRQRYWGEPFPLLRLDTGEIVPVPEDFLPVTLPDVEKYEPTGTGESPLAGITSWMRTAHPVTGAPAARESNTMPQWAGSCWYYLRYIDPRNESQAWSPEKERYWMPVDLYVGGVEHAVLHLLYARFWHKVLYDLGLVSTKEPFKRLVNQGLILGEDGEKMSKSRGNVVNPDEVVENYGADALRLYEMFMGPLERVKPWQRAGIEGVFRFLTRLYKLVTGPEGGLSPRVQNVPMGAEVGRLVHQTIKKVGHDIENLRFNTAISQLMIFLNGLSECDPVPREAVEPLVLLTSPFAPHLGEELWRVLGHAETLAYEPWPTYDEALAAEDTITLVVQVNGKVRDKIAVPVGIAEAEAVARAQATEGAQRFTAGKTVVRTICVQGKLVNIVVK